MSKTKERPVFTVDLGNLKRTPKPTSNEVTAKVDKPAQDKGFVSREPKRKGGRPASPRTEQIHTKVLPGIGKDIADEAVRRGVTQGVIIEEAWALYLKENVH